MRKRIPAEKPDVSAKQKALDLLLYRTRTEKELFGKLTERGYSEEEAAEALAYVKSYGYVDDEEYAKRYAQSHASSEGKHAIRRKLREKGVDDEWIEAALSELPDNEEEIITEQIIRKYGEPHRLEEKEFRRIYGYLVRHGFGGGAIMSALKNYQNE